MVYKTERSRANTFLILGNPATILWMSILSGYLIKSVGWRWMFIWEGLARNNVGFLLVEVGRELPKNAKWLTEHEKQDLEDKLQQEQDGYKACKELCRSIQIANGDIAMSAICFVEYWSIRFCDVASVDHQCSTQYEYCKNRMALLGTLCVCNNWHVEQLLIFLIKH